MSQREHPSSSYATTSDKSAPDRTLAVRPWWDPHLAIEGHPVGGEYVERFWLGVLGPSVICLLRRLARGFESYPSGFQISISDTARAIGLGGGTGQQSPINRTIERACTFNAARRSSEDTLAVRLHLPTLSGRQLARLPLAVRTSHSRWIEGHTATSHDPRGPVAA